MEEPSSPDSDYDDLPIPQTDGSPAYPTSLSEAEEDDADTGAVIPYGVVHAPPLGFKAQKRLVFIPGQEITIKFTGYDRSVTTHLLSPNLYTIELQHGDFTWTIRRRYKHIQHLHQQLKLFRHSLNFPFPTRAHRERRTSFKLDYRASKVKRRNHGALPRFPNRPEALVPYENIEQRMLQLEEYLQNLLRINLYRNHHETISFLEVSHLSFVRALGSREKGKEGVVLKRTGSTQPGCNFCGLLDQFVCVRCGRLVSDLCGTWRQRWLFVKDTYLGYVHPKDGRLKCVMLFDSEFSVSSGTYSTGLHHGLHISNLSRQIVVKSWTKRKIREWNSYIRDVALARDVARDFTQKNRHNSFAPQRNNVHARWFVDGSSYMSAVADALEAAQEEIFIADWWLSPEIYMKRPCVEGDHWRLDKILERKAAQGVKVFVLLYKEVEMALGINSYYSKQRLVATHPSNVKVLRHPDHAKVGVFLWAHHEKIVVVDQSYAFLGGIDLCYGRWDDQEHRLADLGSVSQSLGPYLPLRKKQTSSNPTAHTAVPRTLMHLAVATNTVGVGVLGSSQSSLNKIPDEKMKCNTPPSERRSLLEVVREKTESAKQRSKAWMSWLSTSTEEQEEPVEVAGVNEEADKKENILVEKLEENGNINGLAGMAKYWVGKDYTNFIVKDFNNLDLPYQDLVDRTTTPRMPWHDIGVMVIGAAARDVARHFIQRWNSVKQEKAKLNVGYPYLLPKSYDDVTSNPFIADVPFHKVNCQVLRSASNWSAGFLDAEHFEESIHVAYIDVITKSKHYIYIENQFFISLATGNTSAVHNQICEALYKRILRAYNENAVFRVFVVMPLLPGFEGEVGGPTGTALHAITHWNYVSICRGKDSILNRLQKAGIQDPSKYITFHGLRTHSVLNGELVTELIYVHSKLLIADDRVVICGSANINDRSMLGKRDSEIAVIIEDMEFEHGLMNGENYDRGLYASALRTFLFQEHLGPMPDVSDPVSEKFFKEVWQHISHHNTTIYEEVFHCIPSDSVETFGALRQRQEEVSLCYTDPTAASRQLDTVQGHLVDLPLYFLSGEVLTPNPGSMEAFMPTSLWT